MDSILNKLKNKEVLRIGRASDMLCVSLGHWIQRPDKSKQFSETEIHYQCPWRIIDLSNQEIILASFDIYLPIKEEDYNETYNWDIRGNNLFDKFFEESQRFSGLVIEDIQVDGKNDLRLFFSNHTMLETFICTSVKTEECWRVFSREGDRNHLVVYPNKFFCLE